MTDMDLIVQLVNALGAKSYPLAVGIGITLVLAIVRQLLPEGAWDKYLSKKLQWIPAVVLAALSTLAMSLMAGEDLKLALLKALYGGLAGGLVAIGVHRTGKELLAKKPTEVELPPLDMPVDLKLTKLPMNDEDSK